MAQIKQENKNSTKKTNVYVERAKRLPNEGRLLSSFGFLMSLFWFWRSSKAIRGEFCRQTTILHSGEGILPPEMRHSCGFTTPHRMSEQKLAMLARLLRCSRPQLRRMKPIRRWCFSFRCDVYLIRPDWRLLNQFLPFPPRSSSMKVLLKVETASRITSYDTLESCHINKHCNGIRESSA